MRIKMSQLKQLVREGIARLREDYEVGADDTVDLENPMVLWNNAFDMDDQETMNKIANRRINLNDPLDDDKKLDQALRTLMSPPSNVYGEAKKSKKRARKDSHGCESPFAIDKYAKSKSKLKDKPMSMKEVMEDKYPSKAGWQGERDDDDGKAKKRKRMRAQIKGKKNPMRGPFINKKEPKVSEDKYPKKDGWQGERYRGDKGAIGSKKKKKQKTPLQSAKCDEAPKSAVKSMKKKGVDNPFALAHYMKNQKTKPHGSKKSKKKNEEVESDGSPRVTLPKHPSKKLNKARSHQ